MRFGFRLLYNELAFTYNVVSKFVSLGQWHEWQKSALQFLPNGEGLRVLELAHGTGKLHSDIILRGYNTTGIDLSPSMGRIATKSLSKLGLQPKITRCRAGALPFRNRYFNAVVSTFPTSFILEASTLKEVHRVLVDGGTLVIVYSGILTGRGLISRVIEWLYAITGQRGQVVPM